ncbi:precorrin-6A synthase (deacetylating) [uncultured Devosia sp.]|uniref:precorrin-6A synthase (deacetylating) n=1 Tax=uncultured Devosia sp. TaxID=211434 RepID=UPI0035C98D6D
MKSILIVGIGTGNPEHLTIQAINALNRADLLLIPDKGADKADLAQLRRDIVRRYVTNPATRTVEFSPPARDPKTSDYAERVADWHGELARQFGGLLDRHLLEGGVAAFLVWGDPGLYDSTIRIFERLRAEAPAAYRLEIIAGITSIQALTAAHGIALNRVGEPVHVTTGRQLLSGDRHGDTVVMLDGQTAFAELDADVDIFWGAYLGTPDQILVAGRLSAVREQIIATRKAARERHGWIMDIYLLRARD